MNRKGLLGAITLVLITVTALTPVSTPTCTTDRHCEQMHGVTMDGVEVD